MATTKYKKNNRGEWATQIWDGTYNADGTKHRKYLVSKKSSADLERKVQELKHAVENNGVTVYDSVSFGEYKLTWLNVTKATREKNTIQMYRNILSRMSAIDDIRVSDLRHAHFQQLINNNVDHPRTCQQIALTMKQIVKMAVRDRILPRNAIDDITEGISLPKYQKPQKRALTPVEKAAVQNVALDARKMAYLYILYSCGLRKGETLALTKDDFDWQENTVTVTKTLIFAPNPEIKPYPKSQNGVRTVPVPASAVARIRPFVDASDGGCLFRTQNGSLMTQVGYERMWRSIVTGLNIAAGYNPNAKKHKQERPIQGLTAHIFRHNYCTELCYQIPDLSTKMIARMLGDTEKMVLEVYSHIVEEKESPIDAINRAFC